MAAGVFGVVMMATLALMPAPTALAGTGINKEINFQGKVVNADGTNVADGSYSFVFSLYTAATGGTAIWTETVTLPVTAGIFQYDLGSDTGNPLPGSVDFNTNNIYLGMSFNGDPEMTPRIQFTASPYAFNSDELQGLTAADFAQLNPATAQSGSLNVTGDVTAGTALQAPLVDTATAVGLDIGTGTASSVTIGRTTTPFTIQGDASSVFTATSGSNTTTVGFAAPTATNSLLFPDAGGTICTTVASTCDSTYATSLSGTYLAKNTSDTSAAAITAGNYLYGFTNSQATATTGGVLDLSNGANTGDTLYVTASGNPAASTNALIVANNTAAAPAGNLLDLQNNSANVLSVDYQGNMSQSGGSSTTDTINGQTISAAANFTGTVTAATSVLTPLVDTSSAGILAVGTNNATEIDLNQNSVVASNKSFTANGTSTFQDATNSNSAFQVNNSSGTQLLGVDSAGSSVNVPSANFVTADGGFGTYGNLLQYSERYNGAPWDYTGTNAPADNSATAPNGTNTASTVTTTSSSNYLRQAVTVTPSTTYTFSWWAKAGTMTPNDFAVYDLTHSALIVGSAYAAGTGWQRFSTTFTTPAGTTQIAVYPTSNSGATSTGTVYLWGMQLEQSATAGTYVPTTSTAFSAETNGLTVAGNALIENQANSTTAFQVQNAAGASVVAADTTNGQLVLGTANQLAGSILLNDAGSANTATLDLQGTLPGNATYQLPNVAGSQVVCTTLSTTACGSVYQVAGSYLLQSPAANDASTSNFAGYQYTFTQNSTGAAGALQLANAGTSAALDVTGSGNPTGTNALAVINNTAATPSGNSLAIQTGGVNELAVDYNGNINQINGSSTTDTINGQTISATANFTGTVTAATSVLAPAVDTASAGTLSIGTTNATTIDVGTGTGSETVAIGSGATGANTDSVTVGSNNSTSTTNINGGTGTSALNLQAGNLGQINVGTSSSNTIEVGGVAGTIGYTSVGTTQDNGANGIITAGQYTAPSTGTLDSLSVYIGANVEASPDNQYQMALYTDNGSNAPGSYIASTAVGTITASAWNTLSVSASVTAGTKYWLVYWTNSTSSLDNAPVYNYVSGQLHYYAYASAIFGSGADNGMPATFPTPTADNNEDYFPSFFATYGSASGPALVVGSDGSLTDNASATFKDSTNSTTALQIQNASGYSLLNADTSANVLTIGNITSAAGQAIAGKLDFADGTSDGFGGTVQIGGALTANATYNLPNLAGSQTICTTNTSSCSSNYYALSNGTPIVQAPTSSAQNTIAPTTSSVVALTVEGTSGATSADVLDIYNSAATPTLQDYFDSSGSFHVGDVIQPTSGNAIDLGTSGAGFRTGYFGTSVVTPSLTSTGALAVTSGGTSALTLDTSGAASVNIGTTNASGVNIGNGSVTTAITGNTTVSGSTTIGTTGSASLFKNNGATQDAVCAYTGVSGATTLNTVGETPDDCTTFAITDTAAATITVPAPTAGSGSVVYVTNMPASTSSLTILGQPLAVGDTTMLIYNGTAWTGSGGGAGSVTLQQAYNNSAGASPSILETAANAPLTVQSAYSSGIAAGSELFGVHAAVSGDTLGSSIISATSYGLGVNLGTDSAVSGYDLQFGGNANRVIGVISATAANQQGGNLTVEAGNANGSTTGAVGGALDLYGGNGAGTGTSASGGAVVIQGGAGTNGNASALGGAVTITGGSAGAIAGAMGGAVSIVGGAGTSTGTGAAGNTVSVTGGAAGGTGNNAGGSVSVQGGTSTGSGTGGSVTISGGAASSTGAGGSINITGANGGASGVGGAGGDITLQGGNASGTGVNNGGSISLAGGTATGGGNPGIVSISSPVFNSVNETFSQTANGQTFDSTTNPVLQTNLDEYGTIVMDVTGAYTGAIVNMPNPTNQSAGHVIYISAASGSVDFTLAATGMSSVNMSPGNTAALIWNGSSWSGTTTASSLQQVYNNTSTAPASIITTSASKNILLQAGVGYDNANVFQVGNSDAAPVIAVDTTNTATGVNVADNGGVESGITGWTAFAGTSGATVSQNSVASNLASGYGSVDVHFPVAGTGGANNDLGSAALLNSTTYNVSFDVKSSTGSPALTVQYYENATTVDATCTTPTNGTVNSTSFFKYVCYFTTDTATLTTANFLQISTTSAGAMDLYIDNLFVGAQNSTGTADTADLQVGGPLSQGLTLLTLDTFASDPFTGTLNQNLYGSMYYNTTLGRIQCYESDGWGSCGAAPDTNLILEPEYAGAVLNPGVGTDTHIGTMTADVCSYAMGINPTEGTLCANPGDEYNYYRWTTSQVSAQTYSIFVKYQLPPTFGGFENASTLKMVGRVSSTTDASVDYVVYRVPAAGGAATECGTPITVTTTANTWQTVAYNSNLPTTGGDVTTCGFQAGDIVMFRVDVSADNNAYAYAGRITFTMLGK